MQPTITKTTLPALEPLRSLFLQENNVQVRYHACHERGWSDEYLLTVNGLTAGYGSVKGKEDLADRDAVFEFYLLPAYRKQANLFFLKLLETTGAKFIECQSNLTQFPSMLFELGKNIRAEAILFLDKTETCLAVPGTTFRRRSHDDPVFKHSTEPVGDYVLTLNGEVVATGGFLQHYNHPFADLYMEVREDQRRKGLGSLILQETKKACYRSGRVPAARCNVKNQASKATLLKADFEIGGYMLVGEVV